MGLWSGCTTSGVSGHMAQYLVWWYALWSRGQQPGTDDYFPPSPISPAPNQHILKGSQKTRVFFNTAEM